MCRLKTALFFLFGFVLVIAGVVIFSFGYKVEGISTVFAGFGIFVLAFFYSTYTKFFSENEKVLLDQFSSNC